MAATAEDYCSHFAESAWRSARLWAWSAFQMHSNRRGCVIYTSSGTDIAVIQQTFLNTSLDESATPKVKALPAVAQATPVIYNVMDLTPEVNALVYGWKADSYESRIASIAFRTPFARWSSGSDAGRSAWPTT